jgi:hypothetical protein
VERSGAQVTAWCVEGWRGRERKKRRERVRGEFEEKKV